MTDPEATQPPTKLQRYLKAEGWFDRHVAEPLSGSAWTLALFVTWTVAMLAFGFWAGLRP